MASDPDSCIPGPLKDFVFDLHDCVCRSQIHSEQVTLYNGTFRELTAKYFAQGPWPSPQSIASECGNDDLFLALYKELTQRHLHSVSRPQVQDRIDGWHVYRNLFDLILKASESQENSDRAFYLLPEWCFDILHEFVYQFQGFCQFRTSTFANACKNRDKHNNSGGSSNSSNKDLPGHLKEALELLSHNRDAWAVETVLFYLHRLINVGTNSSVLGLRYLSYFATVVLSRLECLLGDYHASLEALNPLQEAETTILTIESMEDDGSSKNFTTSELVQSVFAARLSMSYHSAVSYLMLRRYKDATRVLSEQCVYMQRSLLSGAYLRQQQQQNNRKNNNKDNNNSHLEQYQKLFDRMVALLAILVHACPYTVPTVADSILRIVREKHGKQWNKIDAGEEGYEDLFIFACPKFISPAVPDYAQATTATTTSNMTTTATPQDAYKLQVKHFMNEMAAQPTFHKLRSYMKLYTSISVTKLAAFNDIPQEEEFLPLLLSYKHKMRQMEQTSTSNAEKLLDGSLGTAMDIHYYIHNDMVHVDEAEKQRRFENYFLAQIHQNEEVRKDVEGISIMI